MTTLEVRTSDAASSASMPKPTMTRLAAASARASGSRARGVVGSMPGVAPVSADLRQQAGAAGESAASAPAAGRQPAPGVAHAISFCAAFKSAADVSPRSP